MAHRTRRTSTFVVLLGTVSLAACHHTVVASRVTAVIDTVAGVPRVTWPGKGGPKLDWTLDTVAVIGTVMGEDPHYELAYVPPRTGVAGDGRGDLFVLDETAHHVVSYDSTGAYVATYGRPGKGPGELGEPLGLAVGPGDTVWVQGGMSTLRLTGFPAQGGDPRVLTRPTDRFVIPPLAVVPGAFITQGFPIASFGMMRRAPSDNTGVVPLLSIRGDGSAMDTIWSRPGAKLYTVRTGTGAFSTTPTYEPTLRWAVLTDGSVAVASDATYTIHLLGPDGRERMRIARDLPSRPVDGHDRKVARDRLRTRRQPGPMGNDRKTIEIRAKGMVFAPTVPRITGIRVDGSDRLWVGVSLDQPDSTQRIDVFEPDGHLVGSIRGIGLPATFFASDLAAAVRKDPRTDVQQVVVLRLREGGR